MITAIVPIHNQGKYIKDIVSHYEKQTLLPDELVFVLDRCTDDSEEILSQIRSSIDIFWYIREGGSGHQAGSTRNFGLKHHPNSDFYIFTDGDCLPSEDLVKAHIECLSFPKAIISFGKRNSYTKNGSIETDFRDNFIRGVFSDVNGRLILNKRYGLEAALTYTCNLGMNKEAIDMCSKSNEVLTGTYELFNHFFDGQWGGEDNLIGSQVFVNGGYICSCRSSCYVDHFWHESASLTATKAFHTLKALVTKLLYLSEPKDIIMKRRSIPGFESDTIPFNCSKIITRSEETDKLMKFFKYETEEEEIVYRSALSRNLKMLDADKDYGLYSGNVTSQLKRLILIDIDYSIFRLDENCEIYLHSRSPHWRSIHE